MYLHSRGIFTAENASAFLILRANKRRVFNKIRSRRANKYQNSQAIYLPVSLVLAEKVGFEPTCPCGQPHFECGSL